MPNIAEIVDHEKLFREIVDSGVTPVIINDLPCTTESDKEKIKELTLTQLTSDTLSIIPTCGGTCNSTRGQYALGRICPICKNEVRSTIGGSARSILWMRAPNGIDKLVNIVVWNMLSSYFTKSNYNAIAWLTDSAYAPNNREPIEIEKLRARGHDRDLNYFVRNFDDIFEDLMEIFEEKRAKPFSDLRDFIASVRDIMFTKYLPLPSKNLFITDKTILGIWMESAIQEALDTIYHFVSIDLDFYDKNPKVIANRTARVLARQGVFYHKYIATNLQPKPGHYRRCILGSRDIFSGRGVIISETGDHDCNEVGIPWRIAVPMYQHHLIGKLMRHGYSQNGALGYVMSHVAVYDKLLHRFLDEVFSEFAGGKGPVFILHRNRFA